MSNTSTNKELQQILIDLARPANIARIKMTDQKVALDIAGFAGIPTQDARGNILQSIWSKHYDTSSVGLLLERNDVRVLLLKQLEQQIKEQKDSINMLEQSDVLCKWILDFTQSWENQYNASKLQNFDIGQVVLSAMQETFFVVDWALDHFCKMLDHDVMRTCMRRIQTDDRYILHFCIDHRGFPRSKDAHSVSQ